MLLLLRSSRSSTGVHRMSHCVELFVNLCIICYNIPSLSNPLYTCNNEETWPTKRRDLIPSLETTSNRLWERLPSLFEWRTTRKADNKNPSSLTNIYIRKTVNFYSPKQDNLCSVIYIIQLAIEWDYGTRATLTYHSHPGMWNWRQCGTMFQLYHIIYNEWRSDNSKHFENSSNNDMHGVP